MVASISVAASSASSASSASNTWWRVVRGSEERVLAAPPRVTCCVLCPPPRVPLLHRVTSARPSRVCDRLKSEHARQMNQQYTSAQEQREAAEAAAAEAALRARQELDTTRHELTTRLQVGQEELHHRLRSLTPPLCDRFCGRYVAVTR